jgi:hypothetical protein
MISFGLLKDSVLAIGAPATAIMATFFALEFGWVPLDTTAAKGVKAATVAAEKVEDVSLSMDKSLRQHRYQMQQTREQTDDLLSAFREICFNTAKLPERQRACGNLVRHSSPPSEGDSSVAR